MPKSDELFDLINSLTKSEKRYVRLYAGGGNSDSKVHMKLFEAMEKQSRRGDVYDEQMIRRQFKEEPFIDQLHVPKNYLKEMIYKALRVYHSNISVNARLKDYLRDIEILYKKGLYDQCSKRIKIAEKLAKQFDKHESLIELMGWKKNISVIRHGSYTGLNIISEIVNEEERAAEKIKNYIDYWKLSMGIMGNNLRAPGTGLNHDSKLKYELLADEKFAKSFPAKQMYYFVKYTQNVFEGDLQEAYYFASSAVRLIEQNPDQIREDPISYANAINNVIPICFRMKRYDEIAELIRKIKDITSRYKVPNFDNIKLKIYLRTYNHELELYRDKAMIREGLNLIPEIESFISKYNNYISRDYFSLFRYQFAYFYFVNGNYSQALIHLNDSLNSEESSRTDIQVFTRILYLMLHYELKNFDLIEHLCSSTQRFMNQQNRLFKYEFTIINFFRKISKNMNSGTPEQFIQLSQDLKKLEKEGQETLDFININAWIQSKLDRTTFEKALKGELLIYNE